MAAAASAGEELVRALNKGYKSFQWPRYKPVTRQPSLSLKMTAPHQHASINQMHAASSMVLRLPTPPPSCRRCKRRIAGDGSRSTPPPTSSSSRSLESRVSWTSGRRAWSLGYLVSFCRMIVRRIFRPSAHRSTNYRTKVI